MEIRVVENVEVDYTLALHHALDLLSGFHTDSMRHESARLLQRN